MFWFLFFLFIAVTVVGALLMPRPKSGAPQPSSLGDFQFPTAEEGRPIPVICGTVIFKGGNTVWWGALRTQPIKRRSGLFSKTTVGYNYYLGIQYMLCHGIVEILEIISHNKNIPFTPTGSDPANLAIDSPGIFGGDTQEGGLKGNINFYRGSSTQPGDPYLSHKTTGPASVPVYSGVGDGGLSFVASGPASVAQTITITATTPDTDGLMRFSVHGSVSLTFGLAKADTFFDSPFINFTITTGPIPFVTGDQWTLDTFATRSQPTYKGIAYAVFKDFYVGTSNYPKPIFFVLRRCPDPLAMGGSFANINGDANAAFVIYDFLTNVEYGLGYSSAKIDTTSFQAAATTLKNEGLGISMIFDTDSTADEITSEILRHIDGVLYTDPATGLWTLKLARADYDPATVPVLDTSSILDKVQYSRSSWSETTNKVVVNYIDRTANFTKRGIPAYDSANIAVTGEVRPDTTDFKGISNATTATLVAARVLNTLSFPMSKLSIKTNRAAWAFRIGGVFKFTWAPLGISNQIFRIVRIGYGEVRDGKISIDAVEDIFGLNETVFAPPPDSGWVNPIGAPTAGAAAFERTVEAPYFFSPDGIRVLALCGRGDGTLTGFNTYQNPSGPYVQTNTTETFCPVGLLSAAYPAMTGARDATGFILNTGTDLDVPQSTDDNGLLGGDNLALIDDEFISWKTITDNGDGTFTISDILRGQLNTVPQDHVAGARVWFVTDGSSFTQSVAYVADGTYNAKFSPFNNQGALDISLATVLPVTTRSRYLRPYPPGNLCYNGNAYGTRPNITGGANLVATWASRNRLTQSQMVRQDAATIAGESGQTFTVKIYCGGVLKQTITGLSALTYTYTAVQHAIDDATLLLPVRFEVYSNTAGGDSFLANSFTLTMS